MTVMVALHPCETVELVSLADFASVPACGEVGQVQVGTEGAQHWVCFRHAAIFGVQILCAHCNLPLQPNDASPSTWAHDQHSDHVGVPTVGHQPPPPALPQFGFATIERWQ